MRLLRPRAWAALALLLAAVPVQAVSPVPVTIGPSRDGALQDLQRKVDAFLGPGRVDVRTDYLGAHCDDPDPWTWTNPGHVVELRLVDRKSPTYLIGWYAERGEVPVLDGVEDGVVLDRSCFRGMSSGFRVPKSVARFGFYCTGAAAGESYVHCSNRVWNAPGAPGLAASHLPLDGDPQMLVYDISRWVGPQTWLVACEVSDVGLPLGLGEGESDNDYSDVLFTVSGASVTPTQGRSFGGLKRLFR
jgi:hypothetical protein